MTVTEERPTTAEHDDDADAEVDHYATPGFAGALATSDHKQIGRFWILFSLIFAAVAFAAAIAAGIEKTDVSSISVLDWGDNPAHTFFRVWSAHRVSLLFFAVLPMFIGLATYVVPLQVGAPSIAFPRAAAAAFWTWLVGAGIHLTSIIVGGGLGVPGGSNVPTRPDGTAQATGEAAALGPDPEAVELAMLSIGITILSLMLATVCIVTTVVAQRPEGMSLDQVPMFSWSMVVAGGIWMLSLPVLMANLVVMWVDFRGEDALLYGNVENIWSQFSWIFGQPQVFAFAIPALGIVVDIVSTSSARLSGRGVFLIAIGGFGAMSFGAYAQPAFNAGVGSQMLFVVGSLAMALPLLVVLGGLGMAIKNGRPQTTPQLGLAMMTMLVLLAGAAAAAVRVFGQAVGVLREFWGDGLWEDFFKEMDEVNASIISTGVMNLVLCGALAGAVAGLYHWGPKIFGRQLLKPAGGLGGLALFGGALVMAIPQVINGFLDEGPLPFREGNYARADSISTMEALNLISTIGAAILFLGTLLILADVLLATVLGTKDGTEDNPWGGATLEWTTASPPPLGNFEAAPVVASAEPIIDLLEEADA